MRLSREPMRKLTSPWSPLAQQCKGAASLMYEFEAYAREIGCTVIQDETIANQEQSRKLAAWWRERTNG
jgi:hypothetical protein